MRGYPFPKALSAMFIGLILAGCRNVATQAPDASPEPSESPSPLASSTTERIAIPTEVELSARTAAPNRATPLPSQTPITMPEDGKIAYVSCNSDRGNCGIYVMYADGSEPVRLANDSGLEYYNAPDWSPDGTKLVFEGAHATAGDGIYIMGADGSKPRWLSNNSNLMWDDAPAWSPDGEKIAFVSYPTLESTNPGGRSLASPVHAAAPPGEIYVMNADGSDPVRLTDNLAYDSAPAWSPDGKRIVFLSDRDGLSEIYVMDADGSNPARLTSNQMWEEGPVWSPDGLHIAFAESGILVMDVEGGDLTRLTDHGRSPDWSPDGTKLAFAVEREGEAQIYVINSDGSGQTILTKNQEANHYYLSPAWGPAVTQLRDCTAGWTRLSAGDQAIVSKDTVTPNRVRSGPSTAETSIALLYPGSVAKLIEGPICADGVVFWKVLSELIPGGVGWTAEGDGTGYYLVPYTP